LDDRQSVRLSEQIAHHEYLNIQKQIDQSQEVDRFLREKFTNEELHAWMQGEISGSTMNTTASPSTLRARPSGDETELMRPEVDAPDVKFNYWDGGRGLFRRALYLDVMDGMAYHENNSASTS
jgi:hypothetical protein